MGSEGGTVGKSEGIVRAWSGLGDYDGFLVVRLL